MVNSPEVKESGHNKTGRRDFLKGLAVWTAAGAGILASLSLLRQFVPRLTRGEKRFRIGSKSDFPVNTFTFLPDHRIYVYRDHEGIRAVSAVCTHLGCTVEKNDEGFLCPCHGSCYDRDGRVVSGAATGDLPWFALHKDAGGRIVVDRDSRVDPGEKLYL